MKTMMKIFDRSDCNCERQIELDMAKTFCIIGMVLVHCYGMLSYNQTGNSGLVFVLIYILNTIFGAPTFLICMGIGLVYSRKNTPEKILARGFRLLAVSLAFNTVRFGVPYILSYWVYNEFSFPFLFSCIFYVDVLTFAGLALILFGLLKKLKLPNYVFFVIALVMSVIATFVKVDTGDNWILNLFVGYFLPVTEDPVTGYSTYFPLFNWFLFVVLGYGFGLILKKVKDKKLFYAVFSGISTVVMIVYLCICIPDRIGLCTEEYTYTIFYKVYDVFIAFFGTVMLFGVYYFASIILPAFMKRLFEFFGKGLTAFYVIHWGAVMLVDSLITVFDEKWEIPNPLVGLTIGVSVFIVSTLILCLVNMIRKRSAERKMKKLLQVNAES